MGLSFRCEIGEFELRLECRVFEEAEWRSVYDLFVCLFSAEWKKTRFKERTCHVRTMMRKSANETLK
jgi:hypothetical protein